MKDKILFIFTDTLLWGVETVPIRISSGGQQRLGPEAVKTWNMAESSSKWEEWLIYVRIYVKGTVIDSPCPNTVTPRLSQVISAVVEPRLKTGGNKYCIIFIVCFIILLVAILAIMYFYLR